MEGKNQKNKYKVLIVDDSEMNRSILADILGEEYDIIEAEDGEEAVSILRRRSSEISLVLLDIVMPKMDGFEVLVMMNKYQWIDEIPVIMISAESSSTSVERAFDLGVVDYISRPFDAVVVHRRVVNTILLYAKQRKLVGMVTDQIYEKEKQSRLMIDILSQIVEFRNGESGMHVLHIHLITEILLKQLFQKTGKYHITAEDITMISMASALHDVGKIAIPGEILNKPGKLTREEYKTMKTHPAVGAEMLDELPFHQDEPLLRRAYEICRWHHERYDGRGYPDGLKGDEIPISAQVVALADVYDALVSERVYKRAFSHEVAVEMILDGECGVFNPILLECLVESAEKIQDSLESATFGASISEQREVRKITEEMMQHEELSASERTLRLLEHERTKYRFYASMSHEVQFEYSVEPPMLTMSEWGAAVLGLKEIIMDPEHDEQFRGILGEGVLESFSELLYETKPKHPVFRFQGFLKVNGEERWHQIICQALWSSEETPRLTGAIGKAVDIHDEHMRVVHLEKTASHDGLTGLLNHSSAEFIIRERLRLNPRGKFAMFLLDLDYFKSANDEHGHIFGDRVLQHLAGKIRDSVREEDVAARMGGDEFLMFIDYTTDLESAVKRIYSSLLGYYEHFQISVSMGVAVSNGENLDYETLFHHADEALYSVKLSGRGTYHFYKPEMDEMFAEREPIPRTPVESDRLPEKAEAAGETTSETGRPENSGTLETAGIPENSETPENAGTS